MEALGEFLQNKKGKTSWWWNKYIEEAAEKRKAYNKQRKTSDKKKNGKYYKRCCIYVKRKVSRVKNEAWENKCRIIVENIGHTRTTQAWRIVKALKQIDFIDTFKRMQGLPSIIAHKRHSRVPAGEW